MAFKKANLYILSDSPISKNISVSCLAIKHFFKKIGTTLLVRGSDQCQHESANPTFSTRDIFFCVNDGELCSEVLCV